MAKTIKYTKPKIKATGDKWYIWFRYLDESTGKMKLIIKKGGANYSSLTEAERYNELNALRKALLFKLEKQGWNPLTNTYPEKTRKEIEFERLQQMAFNAALDFALSKCVVASKTKLDYGP